MHRETLEESRLQVTLVFTKQPDRQSNFYDRVHDSSLRSDEGLMLETSAFRINVRWSIYTINSVDKTNFLLTEIIDHFTFSSANVIYCITCTFCKMM